MITKCEFNTDPDAIRTDRLIQLLFREHYMPKNTNHSRGDVFWANQRDNEQQTNTGKTNNLRKELRLQMHKTSSSTYIEIHHKYNRQNLRENLVHEKTLNLKKPWNSLPITATTGDTSNPPYNPRLEKTKKQVQFEKYRRNKPENARKEHK